MNEPYRIKKSDIEELIIQNQKMRMILETWPSREIMTDYEKDWNSERISFLKNHNKFLLPGSGDPDKKL
jgi:hypothetical protein